mmetsp:Transcript_9273/g.20104  ORF Transcript_9273/g.20104 Transcript_9273/m.20104 type:complete len:245 (-) Transcript_9273:772-1506(-)
MSSARAEVAASMPPSVAINSSPPPPTSSTTRNLGVLTPMPPFVVTPARHRDSTAAMSARDMTAKMSSGESTNTHDGRAERLYWRRRRRRRDARAWCRVMPGFDSNRSSLVRCASSAAVVIVFVASSSLGLRDRSILDMHRMSSVILCRMTSNFPPCCSSNGVSKSTGTKDTRMGWRFRTGLHPRLVLADLLLQLLRREKDVCDGQHFCCPPPAMFASDFPGDALFDPGWNGASFLSLLRDEDDD